MKSLRLMGKIKNVSGRVRYVLPSLILVGSVISPLFIASSLASASPTISEYSLPTGYNNPTSIVSSAGSMWYLNTTSSSQPFLSKITTSGTSTNYSPLPTGASSGYFTTHNLAVDTADNIWLSGCAYISGSPKMFIGYMNPSTNAMTTFVSSTACNNPNWVVGPPAIDASGNVWVCLHINGSSGYSIVQQFSPTGTYLSSWSSPAGGHQDWSSITAGPNNSLWLTDDHNYQIDQLSLSLITDQVASMSTYTPSGTFDSLANITAGPDGNLWFGKVGAISKMTPSGTFTDYTIPSGDSVSGITSGPDGALWFISRHLAGATDTVGRITTAGSVTEYAITTSGAYPMGITTGPDNALWFTEYNGRKVGRISATPFFSEYSLPTGHSNPTSIVSSAGSMWYLNTTSSSQPFLSKITTSGTSTNYSTIPAGNTGGDFVSHNLTVDTSGNIWFSGCTYTSSGSKNMLLGYMNPSTNAMTTFQYAGMVCDNPNWVVGPPAIDASGNVWVCLHMGGYSGYSKVEQFNSSGTLLSSWAPTAGNQNWTSVTAGPGNSLWLTDDHNNQIDQLVLSSTTDQVTGMNTYTPSGTFSSSTNITTGPDGNLWFGESGAIGKMTPTGVSTDYALPSGAQPNGIAVGPDNALWFTNYYGGVDTIGRVTTSGSITEYTIPTSSADPMGITTGPDNALWFTEYSSGKIGRIGY